MAARFFVSPVSAIKSDEQMLSIIQRVIPEADRIMLARDGDKYLAYGFLHFAKDPVDKILFYKDDGVSIEFDEWMDIKTRDSPQTVGVAWGKRNK